MSEQRKFKIYNNGSKDIRVYDTDPVPDGFIKGSHYKRVPWNRGLSATSDARVRANVENALVTRKTQQYTAWNKGLTKDTDIRVKVNHERAKQTMLDKYGVDNASKLPHSAWNKGLTKDTDSRVHKISEANKGRTVWNKGQTGCVGHPHTEKTKQQIREKQLSSEVKLKRFTTMQQRGTLGNNKWTVAENHVYAQLLTQYTSDDIIPQYMDIVRYPYKCDFYIRSKDLFIEVNACWTHGGRPYDPTDASCQQQLANWQEKAKTSKYYQIAIYVWTDLDIRKLQTAKKNNLNFQTIYYKYR